MNDILQPSAVSEGAIAAKPSGTLRSRVRIRNRLVAAEFYAIVLVAVALVLAGQLIEDINDSPPLQMLDPETSIARWTIIGVVIYELIVLKLLERPVQRSLGALRSVVQIDGVRFDQYISRMQHSHRRVELLLFAISALLVILIFPLGNSDLPTRDPVTRQAVFTPVGGPGFIVLFAYSVLGWAGLSLAYATVRLGRTLAALAREPLNVNVFDTSPLLPFGRIALLISLAPAGVIALLFAGLGRPNSPLSWTILLAATGVSVLALVLPLRGAHEQMSVAKAAVTKNLNLQLSDVYKRLDSAAAQSTAEATLIASQVGTLMPLRKAATEMTTWPFQGTVAFLRALLIASAPLVYAVLSEMTIRFLIGP